MSRHAVARVAAEHYNSGQLDNEVVEPATSECDLVSIETLDLPVAKQIKEQYKQLQALVGR